MKQNVTIIKDLKIVLKDMEPWVKNALVLYGGKKPGNFGLLPREILGNWLMCAVGNALNSKAAWTFCDGPDRDGILIDRNTDSQMATEHVFVPKFQKQSQKTAEDLIIDAITHKQAKGKAYAEGMHLIVFCDGIGGPWHPNRVGKAIAGTHDFASVWAVGLDRTEGEDKFFYWVAKFENGHCPVAQVEINFKEVRWLVRKIQ